jgi:hypothetical protein
MSMSLLRENSNRNGVTNKFGSPNIVGSKNIDLVGGAGMIDPNITNGNNAVGTGHNNSNTYNSYMDDSIGSFMGSLTPTRIDSSPAHGQRHESSLKTIDNPDSFMEIWRV